MRDSATRLRSASALVAVSVALVAAFVLAPATLAGGDFAGRRELTAALRAAFAEYWRAGTGDFTPGLERVVDYWFRYHVAKAVIAAILLVVLVALAVRLWRAVLRTGARGRAVTASAGVLVTMLALLSLAAVMANVQGAVAPYASLLPMLSGGELAEPRAQVRERLAGAGGRGPAAVEVMIGDFARYHVAMAVVAAIVAVVLVGLSVALWRKVARARPGDRRALGSFGVASVVLALAVIVVMVANATTAADPAPALLAALDGGW